MMAQYQKIKDQYPDAFLFYRLGDFYEMFNEDAVKGSQLLELTLTTRSHSAKNPIPMCGVPHKAVQNYIDILVDQGYKVAICEQMEDPKLAKGMVKREVIQLVTPGTQTDTGAAGAKRNNYLTALTMTDATHYGLAYTDLSTGELKAAELATVDTVVNELMSLQTKEVEEVRARHILLKPKVSADEITDAEHRLDSICNDIRAGKFSFEEAASYLSDDKDTKNNKGLMSNSTADGMTSRFQMKDLPTEVARVVDTMKVGEISAPFEMINSKGKTVVAVVKLKSRTLGHKASITEDFQVMKDVVLNKERENFLHQWVVDKIKHTYVRLADRYRNGKYEYQGWVK